VKIASKARESREVTRGPVPERFTEGAGASPRRIEVWLAELGLSAEALEALETGTARLAPEDHERFGALAPASAHRERRLAHIALRALIERAFGSRWRRVPYVVGPTGRLSLPGLAGDFSLAHSADCALIGLTRAGAIGVDIETSRPVAIPAARRVGIEAAALRLAVPTALPSEPEARFLQAWVRLEAYAKAQGHGIGHALEALGVRGRRDGETRDRPGEPTFAVQDLELGHDLFAAVASSMPPPEPLEVWHLPRSAEALEALMAGAAPNLIKRDPIKR
jgi:4'-phosphopantetheinyl transferase